MKMIKFKWFFFAGVMILTQVLLLALDPQKQITQYIHKKWTSEDELPSNYISVSSKPGTATYGSAPMKAWHDSTASPLRFLIEKIPLVSLIIE